MTRPAGLSPLLFVTAGLIGCESENPLAPPTVYFGEDLCAVCSMIISDERFAAACIVRDTAGQHAPRLFDDPGCLLSFERDEPTTTIVVGYVRDYHGGGWIPWDTAYFVHSDALPTPMGFGLAAVHAEAAADALRTRHGGERLDLPGVRDRFRRSAP